MHAKSYPHWYPSSPIGKPLFSCSVLVAEIGIIKELNSLYYLSSLYSKNLKRTATTTFSTIQRKLYSWKWFTRATLESLQKRLQSRLNTLQQNLNYVSPVQCFFQINKRLWKEKAYYGLIIRSIKRRILQRIYSFPYMIYL